MGHGSLIVTIASLLIFCNVHAQNKTAATPLPGYIFRHIDITEGLLVNDVLSITQDHRGFMWLGTRKGLQRYDGLRFTNYHDTADNPGAENWILDISPDKNNSHLSIIKTSGSKQLHLLRNEFTKLDLQHILRQQGEKYTDWNGKTWVLHRNLWRTEKLSKKKSAGYLLIVQPDGNYHFTCFISDTITYKTWIVNNAYGAMLLFDEKEKKVYSPYHNSVSHPFLAQLKEKPSYLRDIRLDSHGNIWVTTWGVQLLRYSTITEKLNIYSIAEIIQQEPGEKTPVGAATIIMEDNHGIVWIGTTNAGLLKYNAKQDNFSYAVCQESINTCIQYNYEIYSLFQDREENIWVGSDKGISIFNPYRQHFSILQHEQYNEQSLPKSEITAMTETANGDLLVGTWGSGISIFDKNLRFKKTIIPGDTIQKNEIASFLQNDDGTIWAGCHHGYLHIIAADNLSYHTIRPPELEKSTIRRMIKDKNGNVWLGLHNGKIAQWNKAKNRFESYRYSNKFDSLAPSPVMDMLIDRSQNFWVSTGNAFRKFDAEKKVFTARYMPDRRNDGSISSPYCYGIEEYNDSTLLIGTEDGGVNFFNKNKETFSQAVINTNKLPYSVYAIKKDKQGNIWFTVNDAIYKSNLHVSKFISYSLGKKVINSFFSGNPFFVSSTGQWFTWTHTKIIGFYPDRIQEHDSNKQPVTISALKIFDEPIFFDSLLAIGKPIELNHKQNFLNIEFAVLQFSGNQQPQYYYRLSGIDKDWVDAGSKQSASYTNLPPGEYIFSVKTDYDIDTNQSTSFAIIISPPFWQTWWFRSLCISFVAFLVYWFFRKRIQGIRHEAELKHKIAETEMMALRAQMNPHFIFNCLNAIDNMIQTNQKEKATTYLNRFAKLIRGVLDSSKNNLVPLYKDVEILKLYLQLEQFRCNNQFDYNLQVEPSLLNGDYKIPPLIVQPFLENAIHHGLMNKETGNRCLEVSVQLVNDVVKYTIKDNGVGRTVANDLKQMNRPEHQSYGIQISTDRIMMHNNSKASEAVVITDLYTDKKPSGTLIEVFLKADR